MGNKLGREQMRAKDRSMLLTKETQRDPGARSAEVLSSKAEGPNNHHQWTHIAKPDSDIHRDAPMLNQDLLVPVLNNTLIFDKILGFLSHQDLLTSRTVNHYWKTRVERILFPKTVVSLELRPGGHLLPKDVTLNNKVELMEKYGLTNCSIQRIQDAQHLFTNNAVKLQHLQGFIPTEEGEASVFVESLYSLKNLITLTSHLEIKDGLRFNLMRQDLVLPSVKNLSLNVSGWLEPPCYYIPKETEHSYWDKVIHQVMHLFPNVECIQETPLDPIFRIIRAHPLWGNLRKITAKLTFAQQGGKIFDDLRDLFPQGLVELHLHDIHNSIIHRDLDPIAFEGLSGMLKRHAATLEHLTLRFLDQLKTDPRERPVLRFPVFPKLKSLEFIGPGGEDRALDPERWLKLRMDVVFLTPRGRVNYGTCFPEIRELRLTYVWLDKERRSRTYFTTKEVANIFVPIDSSGMDVSRTMRRVKFEFLGKRTDWYKSFLERVPSIFPNVYIPRW